MSRCASRADVARRIAEWVGGVLEKYSDELAGLVEVLPAEESRTRWHLGLVVPRVAHTQVERMRAARVMLTLAEDESNVVRCSAVEGLGTLALGEPSLFEDAKAMVETFLRSGTTLAMKSQARGVRTMLVRRYAERV